MKAVLFIALLALACNVAFASHFRYVTMSWSRPSAASGDVKVKIQAAFRSAFFSNGALANGDLISGVGNVDFGDGKEAVPIALRVTATGSGYGDDWFIGETEVDVKYNLTDTYYVVWGDCCRIDGLEDGNSQANYQFVLTVDPTSSITQSPQVVQFPLMYFYLNRANSIQLPFLPAQPSGEVPTFSIRSDNTGLVTASPSGLSVTPGGVVNWTPSKKGMFAIQFGADGGASSLPLDLILVVVDPPSNSPPTIDAPTVNTISFIPGTVVTFPVIASDPDSGDVVTITTTSLPVGSSLPACTPAQQCSETFSWPTNGASGAAVVCFQASDDKGNVSAQKCVTLIPQTDNPCPSGSTDGVGCVAKKVSNKCVGNGFYTKTESVGGCATLSFDEFGVGC